MKRKHQPGCKCCTGGGEALSVVVKRCQINTPGVVVTMTDGATTLTATTDANGTAYFALPNLGTWSISAPPPSSRYLAAQQSVVMVAGPGQGRILHQPLAPGFACSDCGPIPTTLQFQYQTPSGNNYLTPMVFNPVTSRWEADSAEAGVAPCTLLRYRWATSTLDRVAINPSTGSQCSQQLVGDLFAGSTCDPVFFKFSSAIFVYE